MSNKVILLVSAVCWILSVESSRAESSNPVIYLNQFSVELGSLRNDNAAHVSETTRTYFGTGLKYARTLLSGLTVDTPAMRDSLKLEGGVFFYRVQNLMGNEDSNLVLPTVLTARYGMEFPEIFELSIYAGAMKNFAIADTRDSSSSKVVLSSWQPAFGVGIARKYSNYVLRFDYGYDAVLGGLSWQY